METFTPANRPIDVQSYRIRLEIDPSPPNGAVPQEFAAEVEIKLRARAPLQSFTLDRDELQILEVKELRPEKRELLCDVTDPKQITIQLPKKIKKNELLTVSIRYTGKIRTEHYGFFRVNDPDDASRGNLLFTHFEATGARAFFPCNDEPYDKATTEIIALVPAKCDALSNGKRIKDTKVRRNGESWREIHWKLDKPHPTYLVSLAIGPFRKRALKVGNKELSVWVGASKKDKAGYSLQVTKQCYQFFEKYLGVKYPWSQYATIGLPTYLWGGMENTTSTHMNEERTLLTDPNSEFDKKKIVGLAAHELAHQWFGDYVTMKWWDDLWLNEAFASHLGTLGTRHVFGNEETELEVVVETWDDYFRQEDGPRSHPIVDKSLTCADDAFDAINYTKGENILRMLSFYVGEAKFRKGLKRYLNRFALGNATYLDFFRAVEEAAKEKLSSFRDTWLLQRGYPILSYSGEWNAAQRRYTLEIEQWANHPGDPALFTFRLPVVFHRRSAPAYDESAVVEMKRGKHEISVKLPAEPEWVTLNPGGIVLAKVIQKTTDIEALGRQALGDPDPIARVWASFALAEDLRDGASISPRVEELVLQVLNEDPSPYVRNALLVAFQKMKAHSLPPALSNGIFNQALALHKKGAPKGALIGVDEKKDPHGWRQWRSEVLGALGRVKHDGVISLLSEVLAEKNVSLDELGKAARATALLGLPRSAEVLREALARHGSRGYPYQFAVLFAFGAYENPAAAMEIRRIVKTCGSDLVGRLGRAVRDNQTLKRSADWAEFLRDFVLEEERFGEEVKARILQTIEDVKSTPVQRMLEELRQKASPRLQEVARKILEKNFTEVKPMAELSQ